ncbi:hypothetical protein L1049_026563 [Liquidambar formosana]|uniref:Protein WVD2-like 7 n=1 Tax=Liquidambar formosana TaxID=63359 RepID=A0AAP0R6J0_LIQFO
MATDTDQHQTFCNNWSRPHLQSDPQKPQAVSISQILDHGSISFGRFTAESLAWEKWSVFSHNRHQEELEKFKAPGLVAQKKAYFEEYYKKVRAMKALQAERQGTTPSSSLQDEQTTSKSVQNSVDITMSKEEKKTSNDDQFQFSDAEVTTCLYSMGGSTGDKLEEITKKQSDFCDNRNDKVSMKDEIDISLSTIEPEHSAKEVDPESIHTSSEASLQDNLVSSAVKCNANTLEDHAPVLKAKGTVASAKNKTKLDCRTKKDTVKPSKELKPSLHKKITGKADNSIISSKGTTPRAASKIRSDSVSSHGPLAEVCSSVTSLHTSFAKDKVVSSSNIIKGGQEKSILNLKGLAKRLPTRHAQGHLSVQHTSEEITVNGGVKNIDLENRTCNGVSKKFLELNSQRMIPKGGLSEKQRPKVMSMNVRAHNKSNQNVGIEFGRGSYVREGKQKEGKEEIKTRLGRDPKSASSMRSSFHKAPNSKLEHKIASSRSGDLTHAQREPKYVTPVNSSNSICIFNAIVIDL